MATTDNVAEKLDHWAAAARMIEDPDLKDDTLTFALTLLHVVYMGRISGRKPRDQWRKVRELTGWDSWKLRHAVQLDVPRYEPANERTVCSGAMVRREGLCGKPAIHHTLTMYDPVTGEQTAAGGCSRHWPEVDAAARASRKAWQENGSPSPANNTGGVLLRYFSTEGIEKLYAWGNPRYAAGDVPPPTMPRPKLTVIRGGRNY